MLPRVAPGHLWSCNDLSQRFHIAVWGCTCRNEEAIFIESEYGIHSIKHRKSTRTATYSVPIYPEYRIPAWQCSQPTQIQNTVTYRVWYYSQPTDTQKCCSLRKIPAKTIGKNIIHEERWEANGCIFPAGNQTRILFR